MRDVRASARSRAKSELVIIFSFRESASYRFSESRQNARKNYKRTSGIVAGVQIEKGAGLPHLSGAFAFSLSSHKENSMMDKYYARIRLGWLQPCCDELAKFS